MAPRNENLRKIAFLAIFDPPENLFLETCLYCVRNVMKYYDLERTYRMDMRDFILFPFALWAFEIAKK